jgi:uncharacterized protein Veg
LLDIIGFVLYNIKCGKRVFCMEKVNVLDSIKRNIEDHLGEKVVLKANSGRKRVVVNNGVIEKTYPSIFVVRLESDTQRKVTYSYSDVLTKTVQLDFSV